MYAARYSPVRPYGLLIPFTIFDLKQWFVLILNMTLGGVVILYFVRQMTTAATAATTTTT